MLLTDVDVTALDPQRFRNPLSPEALMGGIQDQIDHGRSGHLVGPRHLSQYVELLDRVLMEQPAHSQIGDPHEPAPARRQRRDRAGA